MSERESKVESVEIEYKVNPCGDGLFSPEPSLSRLVEWCLFYIYTAITHHNIASDNQG